METRQKLFAAASLAMLAFFAAGCGKGTDTFKLDDPDFSMRLPPGWKQGSPRASGGFMRSPTGTFFFENARNDDPSGDVMVWPLEGASLSEHVDGLVRQSEAFESLHRTLVRKLDDVTAGAAGEQLAQAERDLTSTVVSRQPRTISGLEAIEVVTQAPRTTVVVYILQGQKVIAVTFGAPKEDFSRYEKLFHDAIETITVR